MNNSIIEYDFEDKCFLCGTWGKMDVHHIFGGPVRSVSDRYGLVVHLCRECHTKLHDTGEGKQYLHEVGQQAYEQKIGNRTAFIKEFIRSYL